MYSDKLFELVDSLLILVIDYVPSLFNGLIEMVINSYNNILSTITSGVLERKGVMVKLLNLEKVRLIYI